MAALCSAQELVGSHKGSFELYGADFMSGEDCQPWLLEINTNPSLEPCSAVTRRLCAAVLRDTLHVVLDHKENPACSTGAFDLLYKEVGWGGALKWAPQAPTPHLNMNRLWPGSQEAASILACPSTSVAAGPGQ